MPNTFFPGPIYVLVSALGLLLFFVLLKVAGVSNAIVSILMIIAIVVVLIPFVRALQRLSRAPVSTKDRA